MSVSNSREPFQETYLKPYVITLMHEEDLSAVVEIEEASGLNRWGFDAYRRELVNNSNAIMFVARNLYSGPPVIGFLAGWSVEDEMHINNIAAHPQYRRMGIGESLMDAAIAESRWRGARFVILEVRASNETAQLLYRKLGFSYIARRRDYYRLPTEDAFVMRLDLKQ